jgi:hypothetical protein
MHLLAALPRFWMRDIVRTGIELRLRIPNVSFDAFVDTA